MKRQSLLIILSVLFAGSIISIWAGSTINIPGTVAELQERADAGDAEAIFRLATMYEVGYDSIPPDSILSLQLYRKSAEAGYAPAMNFLGYRLILESDSANQNIDEGLRWLKQAAEQGDLKASSNMGWLYLDGKYIPQNYTEGAKWIGIAAEGGLPVAQSILGDLYKEGLGVDKNIAAADSLYRAAFEKGLSDAGYKLFELNSSDYATFSADSLVNEGRYYYLKSAPSAGVKLFYMAADKGSPEAYALLGDAYTRAVGVPYDYNLSLQYYIKAALAGNPSAQFIIGELLEIFPDALNSYKVGEDSNVSNPLYWFEQAASQGVTDADTAMQLLLNP